MANFLDETGLTRFWGKLKAKFLAKSASLTESDIDTILWFETTDIEYLDPTIYYQSNNHQHNTYVDNDGTLYISIAERNSNTVAVRFEQNNIYVGSNVATKYEVVDTDWSNLFTGQTFPTLEIPDDLKDISINYWYAFEVTQQNSVVYVCRKPV